MKLAANQLNKSVFLLSTPAQWALRYRDRPQVDSPLFVKFTGKSTTRKATFLDIYGQVEREVSLNAAANDPGLDGVRELEKFALSIPAEIVQALSGRNAVTPQRAPALVLAIVSTMAAFNDDWQEMKDLIDAGRYEASAWFERDRKNLCLTDLFTNREVVQLWDNDVDAAVEDGFLRPPRHPRPDEHDWLNPLLDYASSKDLLVEPALLARSASADRPAERRAAQRPG